MRARLTILLLAALAAPGAGLDEDAFKAALVVSFARYTEWPASETHLHVCVAGRPALTPIVERVAAGKSAAGRALLVRGVKSPADAKDCHLLFLTGNAAETFLPALKAATVLTIGDDGRFLSRGGHIGLFQEEGRFSFEANIDEIRRLGLSISSKLLRLGYVRHGTREGRAP